jgi:hypothetical protein
MVSTSLMVDTSSHPRAQLHRCVERSAYVNRAHGRLQAVSIISQGPHIGPFTHAACDADHT